MDGVEGFLDVAGIKSDERVLSDFSTVDGFDLDLVDGALGALLGEARDSQLKDEKHTCCK
jgi:hypothetical protein